MNRETRNNLIFIAILIVLVAPGGVILFKKKSQPGARPIGAADVVINTTAYMDPYAGPGVERLAPAEALAWIEGVALTDGFQKLVRPRQPGEAMPATRPVLRYRQSSTVGSEIPLKEVPLGNAAELVTSEDHWLQAAGVREEPGAPDQGRRMVRLVVWAEEPVGTVTVGGAAAEVIGQRVVPVPTEARHNLQRVGFVDPPKTVTVVDLVAGPGAQIEVAVGQGKRVRRDRVMLP